MKDVKHKLTDEQLVQISLMLMKNLVSNISPDALKLAMVRTAKQVGATTSQVEDLFVPLIKTQQNSFHNKAFGWDYES